MGFGWGFGGLAGRIVPMLAAARCGISAEFSSHTPEKWIERERLEGTEARLGRRVAHQSEEPVYRTKPDDRVTLLPSGRVHSPTSSEQVRKPLDELQVASVAYRTEGCNRAGVSGNGGGGVDRSNASLGRRQQTTAGFQKSFSLPVSQQSELTNPHKPFGQHVQAESSQEFT